jgi:cytochrome c peroxidase
MTIETTRVRRTISCVLALLAPLGAWGCGDDDLAMMDAGPLIDGSMGTDGGDEMDATMRVDGGGMDVDGGMDADGGMEVEITEAEWAIIETLSPLPAVPADPTNAVADDPDAAALGQRLFFDARFSGPLAVASDLGDADERGRVSCASCHSSAVMSDARSMPDNVSLGANFHSRNAPAIVNSAYYPWTNWGGRFSAQWELPPVVAEAPIIMNSTRLEIAHHIFDHYRTEYEEIFGAMEPAIGTDATRFPAAGKPKASPTAPDGPWEMMTAEDRDVVNRIFVNFGKVIEAYMRLLVSGNSPFDRFVAGETDAISASAQRGLKLFVGSARCVTCHSGPTLSDGAFHNIGVQQTGEHVPMSDDGRFKDIPPLLSSGLNAAGPYSDDAAAGMARLAGLTSPAPESARGAFRTPTLRNVTLSAPYMHSGQHATLEEVIEFYDVGGDTPVAGTLDMLIHPLHLTDEEEADLLELLRTLESEPVPEALRSDPG